MTLRNKKGRLSLNTIAPLLTQLMTIISGFVIPRLILEFFGSEVNGLTQSITQFLSIITFMEAGVGSVIRFNLYKPLRNKNNEEISKIIVSANKFFRTIALSLTAYIIILAFAFPYISHSSFDNLYTALLIGAMSISYFAQYYFGQVNQLLLTADQRGYIQYFAQTITIAVNMFACVLLIHAGAGIHIVKLITSFIFLLRPLYLQIYVKKHYNLNYHIKYTEEPIKQKWNGLAQHITAVILESTDVIVLTIFSTLSTVSVYSAYHMVVYGIKNLFTTATSGIEAYIGNVIAGGDKLELNAVFSITEWTIHFFGTILYCCVACLITPFVLVYTKGILDTNYDVPLFGLLISLAYYSHTIRLPYSICVLSGGHYKRTQNSYIISASINILLSICTVIRYGLVGVAIGTVAGMSYQIIWLAIYCYKNILGRKLQYFFKQILSDGIIFAVVYIFSTYLSIDSLTYLAWCVLGIKVFIICVSISLLVNCIFYGKQMAVWLKK